MKKNLSGGLAVLLWLTSVALGIIEIVPVQGAILTLYAWILSRGGGAPEQLPNSYWSTVLLSQVIMGLLAIVTVGLVVGTGEYHAKHVGERRSWRLFGWTLGIQILILLVTYPFV